MALSGRISERNARLDYCCGQFGRPGELVRGELFSGDDARKGKPTDSQMSGGVASSPPEISVAPETVWERARYAGGTGTAVTVGLSKEAGTVIVSLDGVYSQTAFSMSSYGNADRRPRFPGRGVGCVSRCFPVEARRGRLRRRTEFRPHRASGCGRSAKQCERDSGVASGAPVERAGTYRRRSNVLCVLQMGMLCRKIWI